MPTSNEPVNEPGRAGSAGGGHVIVVGESLIDLIEGRIGTETVYRPRFGGAPLNVAVGAARLGSRSSLVTALAADVFAEDLRVFLASEEVTVLPGPAAGPTTPVTTVHDRGGAHGFTFYGNPSLPWIDAAWIAESLPAQGTLHLGSAPLLLDGGAKSLLAIARRHAGFTSLDPNFRPSLVDDPGSYRERIEALLPHLDLLKLSAEDAQGVFSVDPPQAARIAHSLGVPVVIVTQGAAGALVSCAGEQVAVHGEVVTSVDETGAGDSFMACLVSATAGANPPASTREWVRAVELANRAAAITCLTAGGAESMPSRAQLEAFLPRAAS